jgi:hypothetical protein
LGVGRQANNPNPGKKTVFFRNLIEAKNGLIFCSDTGGGKGLKNEIWMATRMGVTNWRIRAHRRDDWKTVVKEAKVLQGL